MLLVYGIWHMAMHSRQRRIETKQEKSDKFVCFGSIFARTLTVGSYIYVFDEDLGLKSYLLFHIFRPLAFALRVVPRS